jgi:uncharacterized protein YpmB
MERKLREALHEMANKHDFPDIVNIQSVLAKKRKKRHKRMAIVFAPIMAGLLAIILFAMPQGIANLLRSENIQHTNSEYLIHDGYYYVPTSKEVKKSELEDELGEVARIGGWTFLKEGDTPLYTTGTKYYSINGIPKENEIAIEIWGGTKQEPKIVTYQVLERTEPLEKVNERMVLGGKADEKEVKVALKNIREYIPFFHELTSDDLKPYMVELNNDGEHYFVLTHYVPEKHRQGKNSKIIFMRQYETGYKVNQTGDFSHNQQEKISTFEVHGVQWEEYKSITKETYFKGKKEGVIFELSSQEFTSEEVKKYLETLKVTAIKIK